MFKLGDYHKKGGCLEFWSGLTCLGNQTPRYSARKDIASMDTKKPGKAGYFQGKPYRWLLQAV